VQSSQLILNQKKNVTHSAPKKCQRNNLTLPPWKKCECQQFRGKRAPHNVLIIRVVVPSCQSEGELASPEGVYFTKIMSKWCTSSISLHLSMGKSELASKQIVGWHTFSVVPLMKLHLPRHHDTTSPTHTIPTHNVCGDQACLNAVAINQPTNDATNQPHRHTPSPLTMYYVATKLASTLS
jgi:hypothetical protein